MTRVSILTTVLDPKRKHFEAALASVAAQDVGDWEHIIVDDASTAPWVAEVLAAVAADDERIRVIRRARSGGIVVAHADALAAATGEWIAVLGHDDVLEPSALSRMLAAVDAAHDADVVYSDHDLLRPDGRRAEPAYKPQFSPERLRSHNYVGRFLMARRQLAIDVGGFRPGFDGALDHDLVLRLTERARNVVHVPHLLYHWRQSPASVTMLSDQPRSECDAGLRAVVDHCERVGIDAAVEATQHDEIYRVVRRLDAPPLVSVIVPTRGASGRVWGAERVYVSDAIRSIVERASYPHLEFVVVADAETPESVLHALARSAGDRLRVVPFDGPFSFSEKINLGALHASGDVLLLLNDDTELIEPSSIETLVAHVLQDGVAMAGAKLLFEDGTLQHGGHVYQHALLHTCQDWRGDSPGPLPLRPLAVERETSGVTAAVAAVSATAFAEVGGFTEELPLNFNDVDFCLKLRNAGHRIIWTPWASWYHFESRTRVRRSSESEFDFIKARWRRQVSSDPYYNPNLRPQRSDWLELPTRSGAPPIQAPLSIAERIAARVRRPSRVMVSANGADRTAGSSSESGQRRNTTTASR